jgi:membrane protein
MRIAPAREQVGDRHPRRRRPAFAASPAGRRLAILPPAEALASAPLRQERRPQAGSRMEASAAIRPPPVRRRRVLRRMWRQATSDRISLVSAGCAFYAMLALFPGLSLVVSVYGLAFDPATVEPQLAVLEDLVPDSTLDLLKARLHELVGTPRPRLGLGALLSALVALWSASAGVRAMLGALNMAYHRHEQRSLPAFYAIAFCITVGAILAVAVGIAGLVFLPVALRLLGIDATHAALLRGSAYLVLLVSVFAAVAVLLRFGPSGGVAGWRSVLPGTAMATAVWAVASALFSFYVSALASYDVMYGSLGAAVGLLMWFYVSVYVVLLGAELNVALAGRDEG